MNTPVITPHSKEQEAQLLAFAAKLGLTVNRVNEEEELDAALFRAMLEGGGNKEASMWSWMIFRRRCINKCVIYYYIYNGIQSVEEHKGQ